MIPTFGTARLTLRPLVKVSQRNIAWLRDPDVVRYSEQRHHEHTLSTQLRYVNSFSGKSYLWAIVLVETGEHIGNMSAHHDEPNNVSDLGIMIGEQKLWGQGYASEAWKEVCSWLLDKDAGGVRKLECGCMKNNEAMVKLARKSKFTIESERLNHFLFAGNPVSAVLFGRMR